MKIKELITAAIDAKAQKLLQERRLLKDHYQLLFLKIISENLFLKNYLKDNAMQEECKFLADVFFENADLVSQKKESYTMSINHDSLEMLSLSSSPTRQGGFRSKEIPTGLRRSPSFLIKRRITGGQELQELRYRSPSPTLEKTLFQTRLEIYLKQMFEDEAAALAKLKLATVWKNIFLKKDIQSLGYNERQILKDLLLERTQNSVLWKQVGDKLTGVVSGSQHFNFCLELSRKSSHYMFVGALIMLAALFFIPVNPFVTFGLLALGASTLFISLALDAYGRYQRVAVLESIKKDIETIPALFEKDLLEEDSTDDFEFSGLTSRL